MKLALLTALATIAYSGSNADIGVNEEQIDHLLDTMVHTISKTEKCFNPRLIPDKGGTCSYNINYDHYSDDKWVRIMHEDMKFFSGDLKIKSKKVTLTDHNLNIELELIREFPYVEGRVTFAPDGEKLVTNDPSKFSFGNMTNKYQIDLNFEKSTFHLTDYPSNIVFSHIIKIESNFREGEKYSEFLIHSLESFMKELLVSFNEDKKLEFKWIFEGLMRPKNDGKTFGECIEIAMASFYNVPTQCDDLKKSLI